VIGESLPCDTSADLGRNVTFLDPLMPVPGWRSRRGRIIAEWSGRMAWKYSRWGDGAGSAGAARERELDVQAIRALVRGWEL
jgi:hypothetical protein